MDRRVEFAIPQASGIPHTDAEHEDGACRLGFNFDTGKARACCRSWIGRQGLVVTPIVVLRIL